MDVNNSTTSITSSISGPNSLNAHLQKTHPDSSSDYDYNNSSLNSSSDYNNNSNDYFGGLSQNSNGGRSYDNVRMNGEVNDFSQVSQYMSIFNECSNGNCSILVQCVLFHVECCIRQI